MAGDVITKLGDVQINPQVFADYVINRTQENSSLIQSGIAVADPRLNDYIRGGGTTFAMPSWNKLSGNSQIVSEMVELDAKKITTRKEIATVLYRGDSWAATELVGYQTAQDPMRVIADQVSDYWLEDEEDTLIAILNGMFAANNMSDLILNATTETDSAISADIILDAKQKLGDKAGKLTAIVMNSAVHTKLQKDNVIQSVPASEGNVGFDTYLGYRVIVDDKMPVVTPSGEGAAKQYTTFLISSGVFGRGDAIPVTMTPVETDRNAKTSTNYLFHRRAIVLHPRGMSWVGTGNIQYETPLNTELAIGSNWERVAPTKEMGIVKIVHTL